MVTRNGILKEILRNRNNQHLKIYGTLITSVAVVALSGTYLTFKEQKRNHIVRQKVLINAIRSQIAEKEKQVADRGKKERLRKMISDLNLDEKTSYEKKGDPDLYPYEDCHRFCVNHVGNRIPKNQQSLKLFNDDDIL